MKRKNYEKDYCSICGTPTNIKVNHHKNQKKKYDVFVCRKCIKHMAG